jgi:sigma-E factor negative regulatory protein RseC
MTYEVGEQVKVLVARHLGLKAVALGYVYPLLVLMGVLILSISLGMDELKAALLSLMSLLPYYLVLFLRRRHMERTFTFSIQKNQTVQ